LLSFWFVLIDKCISSFLYIFFKFFQCLNIKTFRMVYFWWTYPFSNRTSGSFFRLRWMDRHHWCLLMSKYILATESQYARRLGTFLIWYNDIELSLASWHLHINIYIMLLFIPLLIDILIIWKLVCLLSSYIIIIIILKSYLQVIFIMLISLYTYFLLRKHWLFILNFNIR